MIINSGMGRIGTFRYGYKANQRASTYGSPNAFQGAGGKTGWNEEETGVSAARSAAEKKRMISRDENEEDEPALASVSKLFEQSRNYAETLRKARTEKKSTTQKLKKLQYSYKSISSQLLRSKTSVDAAKVARKARRQLVMLKGKRLYENEKYDSYELEAAITHAQAMVRVARKKVKHLQEEEMVKIKGGPCAGELEEQKEQKNELTDEERAYLEQFASGGSGDRSAESGTGNNAEFVVVSQGDMHQARQEQSQAYEEAMSQSDIREEMRMMELQHAIKESDTVEPLDFVEDAMADLTDEMSDSMRKLLEEFGLEELAENTSRVEVEMDPADYKMMKLKHRLEEMKAIVEADAKYLKAVFNKLEKSKEATSQAASSARAADNAAAAGSHTGGMVVVANNGGAALATTPVQPQAIDVVSTPDAVAAVAAAPVEGGSVDVSV